MTWKITHHENISCKQSILIEGLPGIGNVGKIVVDYLIDAYDAKKIASFHSYDLPNSVYVTSQGISLPLIELYHVKIKRKNFLLLSGDAQPSLERSSYELTNELLTLAKKFSCKKIIALGGIGLMDIPKEPQLFVVGNDINLIEDFSKHGVNKNAYGVIGPIVGVSGLLLGLSEQHQIPSVALLGETYGHPIYIGLAEARQMLAVLDKEFSLGVDFTDLDAEINSQEELSKEDELTASEHTTSFLRNKRKKSELNYIG